jgi:hypothetical protein
MELPVSDGHQHDGAEVIVVGGEGAPQSAGARLRAAPNSSWEARPMALNRPGFLFFHARKWIDQPWKKAEKIPRFWSTILVNRLGQTSWLNILVKHQPDLSLPGSSQDTEDVTR